MEAQIVRIALHDDSGGYEISPARVPMAALRDFARDVDDFLRGSGRDVDTASLDVAVVPGSLAIETAPIANPRLLADLRHLARSPLLDAVDPRRREVIGRWQKAARGRRGLRYQMAANFLPTPVTVSADTDFHADDADHWVRVERYFRGEVEEIGGRTRPNAHIRLPDGQVLLVDAPREVLRDDKANRLYKPAMVRISAEYNVHTRAYRGARLLEFVEHDPQQLDEIALRRLKERGAKAWRDVPSAADWVEELRGGEVE